MIRSERLGAAALLVACGALFSSSYWVPGIGDRCLLIIAGVLFAYVGLAFLEEKAPPEK